MVILIVHSEKIVPDLVRLTKESVTVHLPNGFWFNHGFINVLQTWPDHTQPDLSLIYIKGKKCRGQHCAEFNHICLVPFILHITNSCAESWSLLPWLTR